MKEPTPRHTLSILYFAIACVLVFAEVIDNRILVAVFKPTLIPILGLVYWFTSQHRNQIYMVGLIFAVTSNVLFLWTSSDFVLYGGVAFLIYRIFMIILVIKSITKFHWLAFGIAILPFLFSFSYLIELTENELSLNIYPAVATSLLMSVLAALSLSNYIFEDDRRNSWLLISSLLFVVLMFIFVIERFYLDNIVFQPLSVIIFASAHFAFYKFMILNEETPAPTSV
ncbi:MAG TPA: lysoplasmalogenase family protein [Flavobacterium sp.]|jgi:hypothetical protein